MIRKDNLIKGILIQIKEYKLSQYADDTQIFLDGSGLSLRKTSAYIKIISLFFWTSNKCRKSKSNIDWFNEKIKL